MNNSRNIKKEWDVDPRPEWLLITMEKACNRMHKPDDRKQVIANGVQYSSIRSASISIGCTPATITNRCNNPKNKKYQFA